jgi:hypothetical protein
MVTLDATSGIYDYVRGRVRLSGGTNSYVMNGVNFETATPLASPPDVGDLGFGLQPGEMELSLMLVDDSDLGNATHIAKLDSLVR